MRSRCLLVTMALATTVAGCARHTPAPKPVAKSPTAPKIVAPLPDWAPKNPSPEFLRAAKVLKPLPAEVFRSEEAPADPAAEALWRHYSRTLPAAWELFGSLTDEQIQRFLTVKPDTDNPRLSKLILLPVKSLTPGQRAALDKWFATWRTEMRGMPGDAGLDPVVALYKAGAKKDLSNVDAGFNQRGHPVNLTFWIHTPDKYVDGFGYTIGTL